MGMESLILVVNPGSTSKKYALYKGKQCVAEVKIETVGKQYLAVISSAQRRHEITITKTQFHRASVWLWDQLIQLKFIKRQDDQLKAIGVRVVAPGTSFARHQPITTELVDELEAVASRAPLHLNPLLEEIERLTNHFPYVKIYAISDSAFHQTMPEVAKTYGIDYQDATKWDIYRFGYHGISFESVNYQLKRMCHTMPERVIICHLGGGSSLVAVKAGESVDTTMGLTPLEGLLMSTRGGDVDDGALLYLAQRSGMNLQALEHYLNHRCGLLGVSGQSGDVRELLQLEAQGHQQAHLALEMFIYRIKKYIGAYMAALNGLDVLVFTASIGERSGIMRQRICQGLDQLGFKLDDSKNFAEVTSKRWVNQDGAPVGIAVIPTNEMLQMARQVQMMME